mmetsp:Transcript_30997/g.68004  ORF Transcript_30997/g.68004 Transcript_30997/m.68004 type:complete len:244 (+) Transcript_30997:791-1522(+)
MHASVQIVTGHVSLEVTSFVGEVRVANWRQAFPLDVATLPEFIYPRHEEAAEGYAVRRVQACDGAAWLHCGVSVDVLGEGHRVVCLGCLIYKRARVVSEPVVAWTVLAETAGIVICVDAILGDQERLLRGLAHRLEKVRKCPSTVHLSRPEIHVRKVLPRSCNLVVKGIHIGESRHNENVSHCLCSSRCLIDEAEEPLVDAGGTLIASGAFLRHTTGVKPAATLVIGAIVPVALVVTRLAKLL